MGTSPAGAPPGASNLIRARAWSRLMTVWGPEGGDAVLYGCAAVFAAGTGIFSGIAGYRAWAWLAIGPYAGAALVSALLGRHRTRHPAEEPHRAHWGPARAWILMFLVLGATLVPLAAEVALRNETPRSVHVQPEVVVIAQAGARLAHGKDPYHATVDKAGHVVSGVPGEPGYEAFFPYLPLMAVFGLPNVGHGPVRVTDTRVLFSVVTLMVVGASLVLLPGPRRPKMRTLQFLAVLPSAALPLATGGDDMPVVAFLLLAMVLAQRRSPGWSGVAFGVASAMKFTAWPLAALALFCARDPQGRRAPGRMLLGMAVVAVPVVAPFALSNLRAFVANVVLFPLGISGIPSPAASALPGHEIVVAFPALHTVLPIAVALVGGLVLVRHVMRTPPANAAEVATLAGWVLLVAIVFAPATRVGYLLYPVDFFVWGWMFARTDRAIEQVGILAAALA